MSFAESLKTFIYRLGTVANTRAILSYGIFAGFFWVVYMLFYVDLGAGASKDVMLVMLGALTAMAKDSFHFYFGSSQGSKDKTDILARNGNGN